MTDLVLAECHLPESPVRPGYYHEVTSGTPAAGLVISMSNDGEHKSSRNLTFISYDSACMTCNVTTGCVLKVSAVWHQVNQSLVYLKKKTDTSFFLLHSHQISKATFVCFRERPVFVFKCLWSVSSLGKIISLNSFSFFFLVLACPIKINIPLNVFYRHAFHGFLWWMVYCCPVSLVGSVGLLSDGPWV